MNNNKLSPFKNHPYFTYANQENNSSIYLHSLSPDNRNLNNLKDQSQKLFRDIRSISHQTESINNNLLNSTLFYRKTKRYPPKNLQDNSIFEQQRAQERSKKNQQKIKLIHRQQQKKKNNQDEIQNNTELYYPTDDKIKYKYNQEETYVQFPKIQRTETISNILKKIEKKDESKLDCISIGKEPFAVKFQEYQEKIVQLQFQHLFYVKQSQVRQQNYFIEDQNEIINQLMKKRWWWSESLEKNQDVNFYCSNLANHQFLKQLKVRILYDFSNKQIDPYNLTNQEDQLKFAANHNIKTISPNGKIHNHIEVNQLIGLKKHFYSYLNNYSKQINQIVGLPLTFIINNLLNFEIFKNLKQQIYILKQQENRNQHYTKKIFFNFQELKDFLIQESKSKDHHSLIIQQYVNPLLYDKKLLDLCCFMLIVQINGIVRAYFFEEGYGRLYTDNRKNYFQQYENEEIISFNQLQEFFIEYRTDFKHNIIPIMQSLAIHAFNAVFPNLVIKDHAYELIGLNYVIDSQLRPWLVNVKAQIENINIPKEFMFNMFENVLNLTIDIIFPPPIRWPNNKKSLMEKFNLINKFILIFDSRTDTEKLLKLI